MIDTYKTIANRSEGLYKDKGSKFLAFAIPVEGIEEVNLELEQFRKAILMPVMCAMPTCWELMESNTGFTTTENLRELPDVRF